jgi:hypothetical protein
MDHVVHVQETGVHENISTACSEEQVPKENIRSPEMN